MGGVFSVRGVSFEVSGVTESGEISSGVGMFDGVLSDRFSSGSLSRLEENSVWIFCCPSEGFNFFLAA